MPSEKRVKRRLADGTVKTYTYSSAPRQDAVWTLGRVIASYRRSAHFAGLADNTKAAYLRHLEHLRPLDAVPITEIKRRHIRAIRDELAVATPAVANAVAKLARTILAFAVEDDLLEYNVLLGMKNLPGGERRAWTEAQVAAIGKLPENLRRAAVLGLYTGQRIGDCAAMTWSAYDGQGIEVVQQKTGARLWVPAHAALRAELDAWARDAVTMLATIHGRPWRSGRVLSTRFAMAAGQIPALRGVTFHGLRKTAAARLAEAGCSTHEIAAITGHKTLAMVELYTRDADQKRRATAAIFRLENAGKTERK
jgi:integrase